MSRELGKKLHYAQIALAIIGLLSSLYLSYSAAFNVQVACPTTGVINCANVLSSQYAKIFGVPNGYLGVLFFIAVLGLIYLKKQEPLALLNAVGAGFVAYFLYAEYLIGSICIYCTLVHICTICLLAISVYELRGATGT
ncbi:MAG: vitamin K epoxide reductase family protein [Candidatus Marsarchaeota archaeon]|nr:vitamin K epoxide reductase family protein [Candidatus Marsarchaeota archaeon]